MSDPKTLQDRVQAARSAGVAAGRRIVAPTDSTLAKLGDGLLLAACFIFAALAAIGFGIWTLCALLIAVSCRPGFWLGVVVVAVITHLMGWW